MVQRLRAFARSVGIRLLVPLWITVGAVLAAHALISYRSTQERFVRFARADGQRCSDLIERATHDGMLLNRLEEVQGTFERLAEGSDIDAVRCYDKDGVVVLSANRDEIGRRIDLDSDTCQSCHGMEKTKVAAVLERSSLAHVANGPDVLRHLAVIENEISCATAACHYHPPDKKVLGVLEVGMSMAPLQAATRAAQGQLMWTTAILIVILGVVTAIAVQRVVYRPVLELQEGTRRIARGDLETQIQVRGGHELAQLALAFNGMVGDLRAARQSVTQWSQKLEEKVIEKTEELRRAQHQVLHMEKMVSLGKLSASVAHELNNPLAGMLTYTRLVRRVIHDQPLDDDVKEELEGYLSLVQQECGRCGEIVKNLLVFARRTGTQMAPVGLNQIVERSLMLVRHHLQIRGVHLQCELLPDHDEIVADADQLQQALLALFVNAVEAMPPDDQRAAELSVRLRGDAERVQIDVGDTGVGIPPDVLPHIFEPFFSTKQKESGVGLGLAIVYGIVHRHGGTIEVESEPNRGTVFHVCLPRQRPENGLRDEHELACQHPARG